MCIKIIGIETAQEFDPMYPLEDQIINAKEIFVSYEEFEKRKINSFVREMERMVMSGVSCNFDIKVNANNNLTGLKLERKIENLKRKLDINEFVKRVTNFHYEANCKLEELSEMCKEK